MILKYLTVLFLCFTSTCFSQEFLLVSPSGNSTLVEIDELEPFSEAMQRISCTFESLEEEKGEKLPVESIICVNYPRNRQKGIISINSSPTRDYLKPLSDSERADITFIITMLGNSSVITLAKNKSAIKQAGDRVDHVHPLRFLECIFTDEAVKVAAHKIPGRLGWISDPFFDGIFSTLSEEAAKDNLKEEFIRDFAAQVKLADVNVILPAIKAQRWNEFYNLLVKHLPRQGNPNRYDM